MEYVINTRAYKAWTVELVESEDCVCYVIKKRMITYYAPKRRHL
jgi:hypothetical protein